MDFWTAFALGMGWGSLVTITGYLLSRALHSPPRRRRPYAGRCAHCGRMSYSDPCSHCGRGICDILPH